MVKQMNYKITEIPPHGVSVEVMSQTQTVSTTHTSFDVSFCIQNILRYIPVTTQKHSNSQDCGVLNMCVYIYIYIYFF
jgi:hypothetical protein